MTASQHHYVYAILHAGARVPVGLTGHARRPVRIVQYRELAAATSSVAPEEIETRTEDVMLHESVVEALHQAGPLLPVRFRTILPGEDEVVGALAKNYDVLTADLDRLGDQVELGLTVLWNEDPVDGEVSTAETSSVAGPGARYLQARVAQYQREAGVRARAEALAESLDDALRLHAVDHRRTIYPSGPLAVRAAYLLPTTQVPAFQQAFEQARAQHPDVRCLLSGPWPPYSFVTAPDGPSVIASRLQDRSAPSGIPGQQI